VENDDHQSAAAQLAAVSLALPKLASIASIDDEAAFWGRRAARPVWYRRTMRDYQARYLEGAGQSIVDCTLAYRDGDNRVVALAPLTVVRSTDDEGQARARVCSLEEGVRAPIYVDGIGSKRRDDIAADHVEFCSALARSVGSHGVRFVEVQEGAELSAFYRALRATPARAWTEVGLYTDLSLDESVIWGAVRRRYRSQINQAQRTWDVRVVERPSREEFDEFRLLHREVAGRVTRGLSSWDAQWAAIQEGDGFLVCLRNDERRLVGCALVATTETDGLYAVGAYDRALYDTPVSHVAQWAAIRHLKATGRQRYFIGLRLYPHTPLTPSEKEVSIAYFKEGFANRFVAHHYFDLSL